MVSVGQTGVIACIQLRSHHAGRWTLYCPEVFFSVMFHYLTHSHLFPEKEPKDEKISPKRWTWNLARCRRTVWLEQGMIKLLEADGSQHVRTRCRCRTHPLRQQTATLSPNVMMFRKKHTTQNLFLLWFELVQWISLFPTLMTFKALLIKFNQPFQTTRCIWQQSFWPSDNTKSSPIWHMTHPALTSKDWFIISIKFTPGGHVCFPAAWHKPVCYSTTIPWNPHLSLRKLEPFSHLYKCRGGLSVRMWALSFDSLWGGGQGTPCVPQVEI